MSVSVEILENLENQHSISNDKPIKSRKSKEVTIKIGFIGGKYKYKSVIRRLRLRQRKKSKMHFSSTLNARELKRITEELGWNDLMGIATEIWQRRIERCYRHVKHRNPLALEKLNVKKSAKLFILTLQQTDKIPLIFNEK